MELFAEERPQLLVNLAAFLQSNLVGFCHVLKGCRHHGIENLVNTFISSVNGVNYNLKFHKQEPVNHPISLNAASKSGPATGLRFFTVYVA